MPDPTPDQDHPEPTEELLELLAIRERLALLFETMTESEVAAYMKEAEELLREIRPEGPALDPR